MSRATDRHPVCHNSRHNNGSNGCCFLGQEETSDNPDSAQSRFPLEFKESEGPFDSDDAQSLIEAVVKGVGITQFMRIAIEDEIAAGRLNVVLPEIPMFTTPVYVLHAFGRQLPLRARLFIDFLVEALGVSRNLSL